MSAFFLMVTVSLLLASVFLFAFIRSNDSGQFDDTTSPSVRMLDDGTTPDDQKPTQE